MWVNLSEWNEISLLCQLYGQSEAKKTEEF